MIKDDETQKKYGYTFAEARHKDFIICQCDYCGLIREIKKSNVLATKSDRHTCAQKECISKKRTESNRLSFGADNPSQSPEIRAKYIQTCQNKFGVDHPGKSSIVKEKRKATCLEKYGTGSPLENEEVKSKIKATNLERYGVENPKQSLEIQAKIKQTMIERYGVEHSLQSSEIQEKVKQTCLEKYGAENPLLNLEIQEKVKQTCLEKYGTENVLSCIDIQDKIKAINLEKYGTICPIELPVVRDKVKATNLLKYGAENTFGSSEIQAKIKSTNIKKYGFENPGQASEVKEKIKASNRKKYGFDYALQSSEVRTKIQNTCIEKYGQPYPPLGNYHKTQDAIGEWLKSIGFDFVSNDFTILGNREIDLYSEKQKIAIEYCGLFWHTEDSPCPRDKWYHYKKYKACNDLGLRLLTIFEDEWLKRQEVCKSHICSVLGKFNTRIQARKCNIVPLEGSVFNDFCEKYHLQGSNKLNLIRFGLENNGELVACMSLGRHHRQNTTNIVLDRLCFKPYVQIVGGASKLFKKCIAWAKDNGYQQILSFSDNRWGTGKIYPVLGFVLDEEVQPDYSYVNMTATKIRLSKQSQKKSAVNCPSNYTEKQWAQERNLSRIWDCGKKRWIFNL